MNAISRTTPSDALAALQVWLKDGSLGTTVEEHELGAELHKVLALLRAGKADLERVEALEQAADLVAAVPWESARDHVNQLANAGKALREAKSPDDLFTWRRAQWELVKPATAALERVLKDAWRVRCEQPFREHERLGAVLSHLPGTKTMGDEMTQTAREGKQLGGCFPPSQETRKKLDELVERAAKERKQLKKRGANEAISELLLAAAESRATLADLTPDALQWLKTNNALALFELYLASGQAR